MRNPSTLIFSGLVVMAQTSLPLAYAAEPSYPQMQQKNEDAFPTPRPSEDSSSTSMRPFTGKVTRSKVRLRLQPSLDSPVIKELVQGDMLIITGESDDFYAVQPPIGLKSYVFRTYVLDNVVEASKVNVRLQPDMDAPVIAQLHSGEHIEGVISPQNNKWLETAPPASARFYVSKDYIENIGEPSLMAKIEKQRDEINILLNTAYVASQAEMQKAFPEINLDKIYATYNKVINDHKGLPEQVARAKELLSSLQDSYLQKKIAFLESKTKIVQEDWQSKNIQLNEQMKLQQQKLSQLEQQLKKTQGAAPFIAQTSSSVSGISNKMAAWLPVERSLYEAWAKFNENRPQEEYYQEQRQTAVAIKGIIEPYIRVIKNKPGDYILVNQSNHLPIAYLYSTHINLQDKVGHEATIYGSPRDNHNFAFPAYFVLGIE